ncbi:hypothetical protein CEXT_798021 [Caerostris extrusa]|uniref:Uncharacterized protein n=1 Tax=Caerostris extrusa TaxID=172846 RepID=A0AAV4V767_CAEEX|nr:hypothetical protein CEXT_798021 [Caerostris extrusa]
MNTPPVEEENDTFGTIVSLIILSYSKSFFSTDPFSYSQDHSTSSFIHHFLGPSGYSCHDQTGFFFALFVYHPSYGDCDWKSMYILKSIKRDIKCDLRNKGVGCPSGRATTTHVRSEIVLEEVAP